MGTYTIKKGDTLTGIAAAHNTTVDALARANNIKNPDLIYAGDSLTIPQSGGTGIGTAYLDRNTGSTANSGTTAKSGKADRGSFTVTGKNKTSQETSGNVTKAATAGEAVNLGLQGLGAAAGVTMGTVTSLVSAGEYVKASIALKKLREEKPDYRKSQALADLQSKIDEAIGAPPAYQNSYKELIENQLAEIQNREGFSYDFSTDPVYQMYRDRYIKDGSLAMQDTAANAAALTGGYGNSYGALAGSQAYGEYLSRLNEVIPTLQEQAYNRYSDRGQAMFDRLDALRGLESDERDAYKLQYNAYRDTVEDMFKQAQTLSDEEWDAYLQQVKNWQYEMDLTQQQRENAGENFILGGKTVASSLTGLGDALGEIATDTASLWQKQASADYQREQDAAELALKQQQEAADNALAQQKLAWEKYKWQQQNG